MILKSDSGRIEKRKCYLCTNIDWLSEKTEWTNLNAVGMLVCERTEKKTDKKSVESRYFLTSLKDVEKAVIDSQLYNKREDCLEKPLQSL